MMIDFWVVVLGAVIAALGTGIYYDHQNKKAYDRGFKKAMTVRIIRIEQGEENYSVTWREKQ